MTAFPSPDADERYGTGKLRVLATFLLVPKERLELSREVIPADFESAASIITR
jgi:hypothetical protein